MLLISDLHLESGRPDITAAFFHFLRTRAPASPRLFILGDLFEVWIGDDAPDPLADQVADGLKRLSATGVDIAIMHGNRDFLLGSDYASRCGARLIEEPELLNVQGTRIALLHGDILCTRDTGYQKFRQLVRDPQWQTDFLARPLEERQAFARQARQESQQATADNSAEIMDVTDSAVRALFQELKVDTVIHGHTHRPAVHELDLTDTGAGQRSVQRVVLGDWDSSGWCAQVNAGGQVDLQSFPLDPARQSS